MKLICFLGIGKKFDAKRHGLKNRKNRQELDEKDISKSVDNMIQKKVDEGKKLKHSKDMKLAKKVVDSKSLKKTPSRGKKQTEKKKAPLESPEISAASEPIEISTAAETKDAEATKAAINAHQNDVGSSSSSDDESDGDFDQNEEETNPFKNSSAEVPLDKNLQKKVAKKLKSLKSNSLDEDLLSSSVIYIGHLPFGFFEDQLKAFFSQFGAVKNVKVFRSKKTGRSKGFGFLEFKDPFVAQIAAETMNNYLLYGRILKCHTLPKDTVREQLFCGSSYRFRSVPRKMIHKIRHNKLFSLPENEATTRMQKINKRLIAKQSKKVETLKKIGIEYTFPGYKSSQEEPSL
eukprot:Sdes_comp15045_c0_seq2m3820